MSWFAALTSSIETQRSLENLPATVERLGQNIDWALGEGLVSEAEARELRGELTQAGAAS